MHIKTLSSDPQFDSEVLAINAASLSLSFSSLPLSRSIAAIRVALMVENGVVVFPSRTELEESVGNIVLVTDSNGNIIMIEGALCNQNSAQVIRAISKAWENCVLMAGRFQTFHDDYIKSHGCMFVCENGQVNTEEINLIMKDSFSKFLSRPPTDKKTSVAALAVLRQKFIEKAEELQIPSTSHDNIFNKLLTNSFRDHMLHSNVRIDGRTFSKIRDITCGVDLSPGIHGSAYFRRGETQVVSSVELLSPYSNYRKHPFSATTRDSMDKQFELIYEFPPYSTNEMRPTFGNRNRREMGHGALAERALLPTVPKLGDRFVSVSCDVTDSHGSSSMASVCAASMALMDAGVKTTELAAGIALGLVCTPCRSQWKVITDITGMEDSLGNMDFKVAGTMQGFTAMQLDVKGDGISLIMLSDALEAANFGICNIVKTMKCKICKPRKIPKICWPVSGTLEVTPTQRGRIVGTGGHTIRGLISRSGTLIEHIDDSTLFLFAPTAATLEHARAAVNEIVLQNKEIKLDMHKEYNATVVELNESGVWVRVFPHMQPVYIHISQLGDKKTKSPGEMGFLEGSVIRVKYFGVDPMTGNHRLSRKLISSV